MFIFQSIFCIWLWGHNNRKSCHTLLYWVEHLCSIDMEYCKLLNTLYLPTGAFLFAILYTGINIVQWAYWKGIVNIHMQRFTNFVDPTRSTRS